MLCSGTPRRPPPRPPVLLFPLHFLVSSRQVHNGYLYFAMWSNTYQDYPKGQNSTDRGGIWRMNLAEDKPTKDLVVANPTSILYDSCIIKKDQVRFLTYMY